MPREPKFLQPRKQDTKRQLGVRLTERAEAIAPSLKTGDSTAQVSVVAEHVSVSAEFSHERLGILIGHRALIGVSQVIEDTIAPILVLLDEADNLATPRRC